MTGAGHPNHQQRPPVGSRSTPTAVSSAAPPHLPPVHHLQPTPVLVDNRNRSPEVSALISFNRMTSGGIHPNHQQRPPVGSPSPSAAVSSVAPPHPPPYDETRIIVITGLPDDVKERELVNLLRWLPGYQKSLVNFNAEKPKGFGIFSTSQFAEEARVRLQHLVFDSESGSVIYTEMAKKSTLLDKRDGDSNASDQNKRQRTGVDPSPPPTVLGPPHGHMAPASPPYDPYELEKLKDIPLWDIEFTGDLDDEFWNQLPDSSDDLLNLVSTDPPPAPMPEPAPSSDVPVQNINDNPPCNTLFIGNLGGNINEEELTNLLSGQPGFRQMRKERHTVCFIEFEDVNSATKAYHNLQGAIVPNSSTIEMRIQYSKIPFWKRNEGDGYPLSPSLIATALKDV